MTYFDMRAFSGRLSYKDQLKIDKWVKKVEINKLKDSKDDIQRHKKSLSE